MKYAFYRQVTAAMSSLYLFTTVLIRWKVFAAVDTYSVNLELILMAVLSLMLVIAGAFAMNFVLKSVAATLALIALLGVLSWVSALVFLGLLALIGGFIRSSERRPALCVGAVQDECLSAQPFSAIPVDVSTNLPVGTLGSHFPTK